MPHLRFRALDSKHVQKLSETLPEVLAKTMETSADNFTFEAVPTQFFTNGKMDNSYPFVEVHWFERSQKIKQESAQIITDQIKALTKATDVVVVYCALAKSDYFENSQSF